MGAGLRLPFTQDPALPQSDHQMAGLSRVSSGRWWTRGERTTPAAPNAPSPQRLVGLLMARATQNMGSSKSPSSCWGAAWVEPSCWAGFFIAAGVGWGVGALWRWGHP